MICQRFAFSTIMSLSLVASHLQEPETPQNQLREAIRRGDDGVLRGLLAQGASARKVFPDSKRSPLLEALSTGHFTAAKTLLEAGAKPEDLSPGDYAALSEAVHRGDRSLLKSVCEWNGDAGHVPYSQGYFRWSLYATAVLKEDLAVLKALMEGLDPSLSFGPALETGPLNLAVVFRKPKSLKALLDAFPNKTQSILVYGPWDPGLALLSAVESGQDEAVLALVRARSTVLQDFQLIYPQIVMKAGQNLKPRTIQRLWGGSPEMPPLRKGPGADERDAADYLISMQGLRFDTVPSHDFLAALAVFMELGGRPKHMNNICEKIVNYFKQGDIKAEELEALFRPLGAWLLERDPDSLFGGDPAGIWHLRGFPALENPDLLRAMIKAGVPLKPWRDKEGRTLLHCLALLPRANHLINLRRQIWQILIKEAGLDPEILDKSGEPAIANAWSMDIIAMLDAGAKPSWSGPAADSVLNRWISQYRKSEGPNGGMAGRDAFPMHAKLRPVLNLPAGREGRTPLTTACALGQNSQNSHPGCGTDDVLPKPGSKELEAWKARVKQASQAGELAARMEQDILVTLLLDAGADPNIPDRMGRRPVQEAVETGQVQVLRSLVAHPKGIRCTDRPGLLKALQAKSNFTRIEITGILQGFGVEGLARMATR